MNKFFQALGLAQKAQKIVSGPKVMDVIRSREASLVIVAKDAGKNAKKSILDKCKFYQITCYEMSDSVSLSNAIGKNNRVALAVIDDGLALLIERTIKEEK